MIARGEGSRIHRPGDFEEEMTPSKAKKNQKRGAISAADFTDSFTVGFAYGRPHLGGGKEQGKSNRLASRV